MDEARQLWVRLETIHAVTYFGEETRAVTEALGIGGFWSGYFGLRAAPLGPATAGAVEATFANFAPSFVARWVPAVWSVASPEDLLEARSAAAAATLRRIAPEVDALAPEVLELLAAGVDRCGSIARPLFAANRDLPLPADPVEALWLRCTQLREHRGDGHVAALAGAGVDGLEAHVLISLEHGTDPEDLQRTRGWTPEDWAAAVDRVRARGLVDDHGSLTDAGRVLRASVEALTDRLAAAPWAATGPSTMAKLIAALTPAATAIATSGVIRYPNPMGLPPVT